MQLEKEKEAYILESSKIFFMIQFYAKSQWN